MELVTIVITALAYMYIRSNMHTIGVHSISTCTRVVCYTAITVMQLSLWIFCHALVLPPGGGRGDGGRGLHSGGETDANAGHTGTGGGVMENQEHCMHREYWQVWGCGLGCGMKRSLD